MLSCLLMQPSTLPHHCRCHGHCPDNVMTLSGQRQQQSILVDIAARVYSLKPSQYRPNAVVLGRIIQTVHDPRWDLHLGFHASQSAKYSKLCHLHKLQTANINKSVQIVYPHWACVCLSCSFTWLCSADMVEWIETQMERKKG